MKNGAGPFLKWPGGKRWLAPLLSPWIQRNIEGTYYEGGDGHVIQFIEGEKARKLVAIMKVTTWALDTE